MASSPPLGGLPTIEPGSKTHEEYDPPLLDGLPSITNTPFQSGQNGSTHQKTIPESIILSETNASSSLNRDLFPQHAHLPPSGIPNGQTELSAEAWWPAKMPDLSVIDGTDPSSPPWQPLDAISQTHLRAFLFYALPDRYAAYRSTIFNAIVSALTSIGQPHILAALRRTACILWKAEAQLRAASRSTENGLLLPSPRWARLAWPASAIRGLIGQAQAAGSDVTQVLETSLSIDQALRSGKDERVRKRDVALAILSNAVWFVSTYAAAAAEDFPRKSSGTKSDPGLAKKMSASPKREVTPRRGALPTFLAPSGPTTALSSAAPITPASSLVVPDDIAGGRSSSEGSSVTINGDRSEETPSSPHAILSHASTPGPTSDSSPKGLRVTSRAMEQLASFNVQPHPFFSEEKDSALSMISRSSSFSSRAPSQAEVLETAVLAEAERKFIASVAEDCEERAKMVVTTICIDVLTPCDGAPTTNTSSLTGSIAGSALSAKSDETVGGRPEIDDATPTASTIASSGQSVQWRSGHFQGENLYGETHNDITSSDNRASERLVREGGTFVVTSRSHEEASLVKHTISTALYLASSMLLETGFLRDMGHTRSRPASKVTPLARKSVESPVRPDFDTLAEAHSSSVSSQDRWKRAQGRWSKGLWNALQHSGAAVHAVLSSKQISPTHSTDQEALSPVQKGVGLLRTSTADSVAPKRRGAVGGRPRASTKESQSTAVTSRLPGKFGRFLREQVTSRSSIDGLPEGEDESPLASQPTTQDQVSSSRHTKGASSLSVLSSFAQRSSAMMLEPPPRMPLSASPELTLADMVTTAAVHGEAFLQRFTELQNLAVLVGNQDRVPHFAGTVMTASPSGIPLAEASGGYFASLSSATSVVRNFSGASLGYGTLSSKSYNTPMVSPSLFRHDALSGRWAKLRREGINFYARGIPGRDIHLGQVVEDLLSPTDPVQFDAGKVKTKDRATHHVGDDARDRAIHYLHGQYRIILETKTYSAADDSDSKEEDPALTPSRDGDADVADVAAILGAGRDAARTAVALAEEAIRAAEKTDTTGPSDGDSLYVWSANTRTGEESKPQKISEATWLFSFAKFLESLIYHPEIGSAGKSSFDTVRLFKRRNMIAKVAVIPLTIYRLEIEGPVVIKTGQGGRARSHEDDRLLKAMRSEIQTFYDSARNYLEALKASCNENLSLPSDSGQGVKAEGSEGVVDPLEWLQEIENGLQSECSELLFSLEVVQSDHMNDVRREFKERCRSASARFDAWRLKHLSNEKMASVAGFTFDEPTYMKAGHHTFPGSRYVVREDQPLSIIAFSLSSRDYKSELEAVKQDVLDRDNEILDWQSNLAPPSAPGSRFSTASIGSIASYVQPRKNKEKKSTPASGPEDWTADPDAIKVAMKRKKRGKEASILSLTLRRVSSNVSNASEDSSQNGVGGTSSDTESYHILTTSGLDPTSLASSEKHRASRTYQHFNSDTISSSHTNSTFRAQVTQISGRAPSLGSMFSKDTTPAGTLDVPLEKDGRTTPTTAPTTPRVGATQPSLAIPSSPHLPAATTAQGESPHIKHNVYHGRIKVSCVSWFAEDFSSLRNKWGIEDDFVKSLSQSSPWLATGGKSRSTFFKTSDEKWIGKQLLTVWNVDEKDALLEFAPAYIRYMLNSYANDCPSLLVKIAGFYSLKIKDTKSGETKLKMSVMILENLFADGDERTVKFDLKGIKERRAMKASSAGPTTPAVDGVTSPPAVWWDAEWIENFQAKAFVPEEEKNLFVKALRNDLSFLTESNVMDFSLLVGVNETHAHSLEAPESNEPVKPEQRASTIRVRIVDYISAFTLAKQLESSSKKALKSSEAKASVTVLPPSEYAARFETSMLGYFIGVPGRSSTTSSTSGGQSASSTGTSGAGKSAGIPRVL